MPKDHIAEWLLVLVTRRERAASIVGDLMESSAACGRVWWWSAVLRAAASLLWNGFADSPLSMLGLGLLACLMGLVLMLISIFVPLFLLKIFGITELPFDMAVWSTGFFAAFCLCQFLVGCCIARALPAVRFQSGSPC